MQEKVQKFLERYEELEQELSHPDVAANPEKFTKLHKSCTRVLRLWKKPTP